MSGWSGWRALDRVEVEEAGATAALLPRGKQSGRERIRSPSLRRSCQRSTSRTTDHHRNLFGR